MTIENIEEINAIMNSICYIKFKYEFDNESIIIASSPIISKILNKCYDEILKEYEFQSSKSTLMKSRAIKLKENRLIDSLNDPKLASIKMYISHSIEYWERLDRCGKLEYISYLSSPYVITDSIIDSIIPD